MADDDDDGLTERQHFGTILRAYDNYRKWALQKIARLEHDYRRLSEQHWRLLKLSDKLAAMRAAVEQNANIIAHLVQPHRNYVGWEDDPTFVPVDDDYGGTRFVPAASAGYVDDGDMEKVQSTLKQFVREWGEEGEAERSQAHGPLLEALQAGLPLTQGTEARVLLPGAGLGRLAWEVAQLGYTAQGCEFSYFMLLASNFIMNTLQEDSVTVHPWVLQTCNTRSTTEQVRPAVVPSPAAPSSIGAERNLSMCAGDFLEVYRDQFYRWEAIITCFFIDTAKDVTRYLERISQMLVPGGLWINIGPLLWHWADMRNEVSVELTWEELRALILSYGFTIEREEWVRCGYTNNCASMYRMEYDSIFFVARTKSGGETESAALHQPTVDPLERHSRCDTSAGEKPNAR
mmetsp:Transcript_56453/g.126041  ORF Transcript_56453/g.126041 Transcript_56453/m.126041 type:complete len:403 (-) Transcript_56453:332-1540(-)